jgi:hypothetical protein
MDFFIKRGSTKPSLILELIKSNFTDNDTFFEELMNSNVTFSMKDEANGMYIVLNKATECLPDPDNDGEYFLAYHFESSDTEETGTFVGEFNIKYNEGGNLIVPIREKLRIHVI